MLLWRVSMVSIPGMFEENEQYELIPGDEEHWHIRIKEGEFIESVISFGKIAINEKTDVMNFSITLHFTPDPELTVDNIELQKYAGKILESIMINNLNEMDNNVKHRTGSAKKYTYQ